MKRAPMKTGGKSRKTSKQPRQEVRRPDSMPKGYTCKTLSQR